MEQRVPRFLMQGGQLKGSEFVLTKESVSIGRAPDSDIVVGDRLASRHHARVDRQHGQFVITDCGSRNGTFLNGQRISEPQVLRDGDELQIGLEFKALYVDPEATGALVTEVLVRGRGLWLDQDRRETWVQGRKLVPPVSKAQFRLLALLQREPGRVYSRDEIVTAAWPEDASQGVSDETIDALVGRLRRRIATMDPHHQYIVTMRGHGFKFVQAGEAERSPGSPKRQV
jgi:DNA-binding response OmpR family regulator